VGAGAGALSRYLGELGLEVVALEGRPSLAAVAAERCADLPDVEVVCGPVGELGDTEGFDVVLVCGVLEHAGAAGLGTAGPEELLDMVRNLCRPQGTLVLAIENRLGLKYLLGYADDHLGRPWIGLEGYPDHPGVQTWSRRELTASVAEAGFGHQGWLFPFPDHMLPTGVLTEAAYAEPDVVRFVDQLVSNPIVDYANAPELLTDDRAAHASLVAGGLGPDVANSFLVVASADPTATASMLEPGVLAWRFGDERRRQWLRTTIVRGDGRGARAVSQRREHGPAGEERAAHATATGRGSVAADGSVQQGWLTQRLVGDAPYTVGPTVQQVALDALRRHDLAACGDVLRRWRGHLRALERPAPAAPHHPYRDEQTTAVLPDDHLDVALDNFVVADGDHLVFIDPEWVADGGVDAAVVVDRALWGLARRLVTTGAAHPWSPELTVDELAVALGVLCDETVTDERLARWRAAEASLQHVVRAEDPDRVVEDHVRIGRLSRTTMSVTRTLPLTRLREAVATLVGLPVPGDPSAADPGAAERTFRSGWTLGDHVRDLQDDYDGLRRLVDELEGLVHGGRADMARETARLSEHIGNLDHIIGLRDDEIDHLRATVVEYADAQRAVAEHRDQLLERISVLEHQLAAVQSQLPYRAVAAGKKVVRRARGSGRP
jgi:SAM-dependent methyltransferase